MSRRTMTQMAVRTSSGYLKQGDVDVDQSPIPLLPPDHGQQDHPTYYVITDNLPPGYPLLTDLLVSVSYFCPILTLSL